jgi:ABC-type sugar transport system ATPase subunit
MTQSGVSLSVEDLKKSWGDVEVLSNVNFEIEAGGFLTLLGPSGCGKSTALRLISGLDEVSGGHIKIGGKDVSGFSAADRNLGMVFQNYALFPHMTIAENIAYGLKIRKVPKPEKEKAIARVAELMALGKLLDRKPGQLSGGQQQRVALARVLVSERPLVLMDEPLSNLDAKLRVEIRSEIRSLNKKLGITIVYVTHDQSEALSMSDTVVLMNGGEVAQWGSPKELYEKPANTFSASFIGTPPMNLLKAEDVNVPENFTLAQGEQLSNFFFGVRPESMVYKDTQCEFSVKGRVTDVQYEGNVNLVHLVTQSGSPVILAYSGDSQPEKGDEITAGWNRKSAHLFAKVDGMAVSMER